MSTLAQQSGHVLARGSAWVVAGQVIVASCGLVASIATARVVAPKDFGLMGLVTLTIATLQALSQTGFERALVQRRDVEGLVDVAWTAQVVRGGLLALAVLALAWPLSRFYREPLLVPMFAVISASLVAQGFRSTATLYFSRSLNFRALFVIDVLRGVANLGIVLGMLVAFGNVWALVVANVAGASVELIVSYVVHPHRPRFDFAFGKAAQLVRFGKWVSAMSVLALLVTRADDMFISKYLGLAALGFYTFAFDIANVPATNVTHIVGRVSFPTYARLHQLGETAELKRAFSNVMQATLLITGPVSVIIYCCIAPFVEHVLGAKWMPIVPIVRILVIAGFVRSLVAVVTGLLHGAGRPDLDFWMNVPRFVILAVLIWPACAYGGLEGAALLVLLSVVSCVPTWLYGVRTILGLTFAELVRDNALAFVASAALGAALYAAQTAVPATSLALLVGQVVLGAGVWAAMMWVIGKTTRLRLYDEIRELARALKKKPSERRAPVEAS